MVTDELIAKISSTYPELEIENGLVSIHPLGNDGKVVVYPQTEEEIASVLRFANENQNSVVVMAGGSKRGCGGLEESAEILLSLEKYKGIVEHTLGDMTLTVKAGTPYKEIQNYIAGFNQKIPLDPYALEYATIGGVVSANDSGPKRLGYGSARDSVIGMRIVYPDGTVIRTGGKTVKNVAGYDFNKLFIGSMGTLGVITEITLKLRPLQKYESLVLVTFPDGNPEEIYSFSVTFLNTVMEPTALELLSPALSEKLTGHSCFTLAVCFEDVESAVRYQVEFIEKLKPDTSGFSVLHQESARAFWNLLTKIPPNGAVEYTGPETRASVKIGVKNLDVIKVMKESHLLQDRYNLDIEAHGGLGHGIARIYLNGASDDVMNAIGILRTFAEKLGGYAVLTHLPLVLRRQIDVWGPKPAYSFLFDGIKSKIDPKRILNPKRFVGGI
ncbi:FAD-binding oxidoreductase [Neobacillus dielmonensis]|uniref:FAD-binding oxidoreductase n=1 Tax=Neobacillus dielmonensis TaxID=1347369 RepID=UPI0005A6BA99|nr:FAD-binding oxidoreductase [Neobacillus dielmonensis]